jgi:N6-L-threonylcarbamoyladenine synthase
MILGIESSCDETSASILRGQTEVLSSVVASQIDLHARYGGVVPEVASRRHVEAVLPVIQQALDEAGIQLSDLTGIAVTNRPGLAGALVVGVTAAKTLAMTLDIPIVGVHHLDGHIASARLADPDLQPPFLVLIVSGGHTELAVAEADGTRYCIGRTRDDAAGECYDKTARLMGLPYPGGPEVDRLAGLGTPSIDFPRSWLDGSPDFSFSGLKTAVSRFIEKDEGRTPVQDVAASLQKAIVDVLVVKSTQAAVNRHLDTICVVGGVSANRGLRQAMSNKCQELGLKLVVPPMAYCTDNAAMIAAAGAIRLARGENDGLTLDVFATDPLPRMS